MIRIVITMPMMVVPIQASTVRVIHTWWLRGRTTADGREKISGGLGHDDGDDDDGEEEDEDDDVVVVARWMIIIMTIKYDDNDDDYDGNVVAD